MVEQQQGTLTLRRLHAADVDRFRVLRYRALREHPRVYLQTYDAESARPAAFHVALINTNFVIGAFVNDVLVGYTIMSYTQQGKMSHKGSVWGAYVLPEYRNMSIGKRMRLRLFEAAKMLGLRSCSSAIVASNPAALAVHLAVGYVEMFREKDGIRHSDGTYDDLIHLIKTLDVAKS